MVFLKLLYEVQSSNYCGWLNLRVERHKNEGCERITVTENVLDWTLSIKKVVPCVGHVYHGHGRES